ncbi:MAG TPA: tetratricopeptide repeat protein [Microvirga sp.]|nr:tetratricopeptide repeat protein [Microvirga sp.]
MPAAVAPALGQVTVAANQSPEFNALFQRTLRNPADVPLALQFAALATRLGDYEAAIGTLERVLFYAPDQSALQLELAGLYYRLGSYASARTYAEAAAGSRSLDEPSRSRALDLLADIDRRLSSHQWNVYAQAGLRYQSNANAAPTSLFVRAAGEPGRLDPRFRRQSDVSAFARAVVQHVYDFENQRGDVWETSLSGYASRGFEVTRSDLGFLEIQTGPRLALAPDSLPGLSLRPYLIAGGLALGSDPYLGSIGAGVGLSVPLGGRAVLEPFVEVRERRFGSTDDYPNAREQTGRLAVFGLHASGSFSPAAGWFTRLAYRRAEARNDAYAFDSVGVDIGLPVTFDGPFGDRRWTVTPTFGLTHYTYEAPNPLVDPTRRRRETEWRVGALLDIPVHPLFGLSLHVQYSATQSNLPNYDTDNLSVTLGPTIRF